MKEETLTEDKIKEIVSFKLVQPYIIWMFGILLLLPLVFAIISFKDLKNCQSSASNGCPRLQTPSVPSLKQDNNGN